MWLTYNNLCHWQEMSVCFGFLSIIWGRPTSSQHRNWKDMVTTVVVFWLRVDHSFYQFFKHLSWNYNSVSPKSKHKTENLLAKTPQISCKTKTLHHISSSFFPQTIHTAIMWTSLTKHEFKHEMIQLKQTIMILFTYVLASWGHVTYSNVWNSEETVSFFSS